MKPFAPLLSTCVLTLTASLVQARDLGPDEALRLRDAGIIQSFEKLNALALATHPGATITDTELESEYGKYLYEVELRDTKGIEWDLQLDAVTGQIYKNHQDN